MAELAEMLLRYLIAFSPKDVEKVLSSFFLEVWNNLEYGGDERKKNAIDAKIDQGLHQDFQFGGIDFLSLEE